MLSRRCRAAAAWRGRASSMPPLPSQQRGQPPLPPGARLDNPRRRKQPHGELDAANGGKYDAGMILFIRDFYADLVENAKLHAPKEAFRLSVEKHKVEELSEVAFESLFGSGEEPISFRRLLRKIFPHGSAAELDALNLLAYPKAVRSKTPEPLRPERSELIALFNLYDASGDGTLTLDELRLALRKMSFTGVEQRQIVSVFDRDGNGEISLEEFLEGMLNM